MAKSLTIRKVDDPNFRARCQHRSASWDRCKLWATYCIEVRGEPLRAPAFYYFCGGHAWKVYNSKRVLKRHAQLIDVGRGKVTRVLRDILHAQGATAGFMNMGRWAWVTHAGSEKCGLCRSTPDVAAIVNLVPKRGEPEEPRTILICEGCIDGALVRR